ncbi:hypothetical protein [Endozoicomonas sp.]|uniref:hypothetical protein n=1 Tax=Endozoicomonas sp. TaxID=1892382 RepID=UPI0028840615|nr:hypothetical protein [Endozoicomonas sp.]
MKNELVGKGIPVLTKGRGANHKSVKGKSSTATGCETSKKKITAVTSVAALLEALPLGSRALGYFRVSSSFFSILSMFYSLMLLVFCLLIKEIKIVFFNLKKTI